MVILVAAFPRPMETPPTEWPLDRLITNLEAHVTAKPLDAVAHYNLGRAHAFAFALERGYVRENPARGIERPREAAKAVPFVSDGDVDRLVAHAGDVPMRTLVRVLADTGLRRSEALRLAWPDVDLERGVVLVRLSKGKLPREVPLTTKARAAPGFRASVREAMG